MREHLRAGVAVHNAGEYHAAHDAWEDRWLSIKADLDEPPPATAAEAAERDAERAGDGEADAERDEAAGRAERAVAAVGDGTAPTLGTEGPTPAADERLLHGLIQFTAAVHKATGRQWEGARSLAAGARTYLAPLPADYRAVNVADVREYLAALAADPEHVERTPVIALTHEGEALALADLDFPAAAVAAETLAEEFGYDEAAVERAADYARTDLATGEDDSPFITLVMDFARRDDRGIVFDRLRDHVQRRRAREEDVDGLFEE